MFERRIPDYQGDQNGNLLKMQIWNVFSGFPTDVSVTFLELFFPHNILCFGFKGLTDSGVVSHSRNGEKQNMLESSSSPSVYIDPSCHCNNNHMEKMQREFLTLMLDKR